MADKTDDKTGSGVEVDSKSADTAKIDAVRSDDGAAPVADGAADLESLTRAHEKELAAAHAATAKAKQELADFRETMKGGPKVKRDDGLIEVRVKTPMNIPPAPHLDPAAPGLDLQEIERRHALAVEPLPEPHVLTRGVNYVPEWVADHWAVKANAEKE